MKVVGWNIRHGGGRRVPSIVQALAALAPDVVILTEYRANGAGAQLRAGLAEGWPNQLERVSGRENGLLVCSNQAIQEETDGALCLPQANFWIRPVYIPIPNAKAKAEAWACLLGQARGDGQRATLLIGDFNTGLSVDSQTKPFRNQREFQQLLDEGWMDCWRTWNPTKQEFSWYSSLRHGFRIDHALCNPSLAPRIQAARYVHAVREKGLSDHSALEIQIDGALPRATS